jgi:Fe-S oxidoreductase
MESVEQAIRANRAFFCLDCGKCTSVCPISWRDPRFSPRMLVETARVDHGDALVHDDRLWECLTCARCIRVCPSAVDFIGFIRDARTAARREGETGRCTHGATIQTWMRIMADPDLKQDRLGWLTDHLRTASASDTVYFAGCLPYYEVLFADLGAEGAEIARGAVRVLNGLGIEPMVLADERCCGHDLLWEGEVDTFRRLAALNTELLQASGAKRVVTTCAECARTLRTDYQLGMEVLHLSELVAQSDWQPAGAGRGAVTYQDPCRLGRHLGIYEDPREVLARLGYELVEMPNNRGRAMCCGTSAWTHCGATAKEIQVDRLEEAKATGADRLVTACAKCQIHFRCAQDDPRVAESARIEIRDLTTLIAEAMEEMHGER